MTNRQSLSILSLLRWSRQLEARVHVLAGGPLGAEPGQVVGAEHAAHVAVPAVRPVPAEAAVVPGTVFDLALRVYMQKRALLIVAGIKAGVEVALWHFGHVILVKELALVALLAQAAQPMLANHRAVAADVSVRTLRSICTSIGLTVKFAYRGRGLVHSGKR